MPQKTETEIVRETIEFYGADPTRRAVDSYGACRYRTDDGRMCAVGRCCVAPQYEWRGTATEFDIENNGIKLEDQMRPEYRGHGADFWRRLQKLHDASYFWHKASGLSADGREYVACHWPDAMPQEAPHA